MLLLRQFLAIDKSQNIDYNHSFLFLSHFAFHKDELLTSLALGSGSQGTFKTWLSARIRSAALFHMQETVEEDIVGSLATAALTGTLKLNCLAHWCAGKQESLGLLALSSNASVFRQDSLCRTRFTQAPARKRTVSTSTTRLCQ